MAQTALIVDSPELTDIFATLWAKSKKILVLLGQIEIVPKSKYHQYPLKLGEWRFIQQKRP